MENIQFTADLVAEIVKKYNEEGCTLGQLAETYKSSQKTLQRRIKEQGYIYDRKINKYIKAEQGTTELQNDKPKKQKVRSAAGRPAAKTEGVEYVKRTYNIPKELDKKLKIRAIEEDLTTTELLEKILKEYLR